MIDSQLSHRIYLTPTASIEVETIVIVGTDGQTSATCIREEGKHEACTVDYHDHALDSLIYHQHRLMRYE